MRTGWLAVISVLVVLACAREDDRKTRASASAGAGASAEPSASDTQTARPAPSSSDLNSRSPSPSNSHLEAPTLPELTAVRIAGHPGFDRVVFEFRGRLPKYKTEYVDRPITQCGSGAIVPLPGDAWLSVRFDGANAHTEAGALSLPSTDIRYNGANVKQMKQICDFEGVVEWVIAVAYPGHFEPVELSNPARLAVDIRPK